MSNENLRKAKKAKNDEFYTRYEDIEKELAYYKDHLKGKWVYCNCDTIESNFWKYFYDNYHKLGLKHLTITGIDGKRYDYDGFEVVDMRCTPDCENILGYVAGDFRSIYCVDILKRCDVVITNPPFSLFREYIDLLFKYEKKFLVVGNLLCMQCKNLFPYAKNKKIFQNGDIKNFCNTNKQVGCKWITNILNLEKKKIKSIKFDKSNYQKIINTDYDIYVVDKIENIPDTNELLLVPISIFDYDLSNYEIVANSQLLEYSLNKPLDKKYYPMLSEKAKNFVRKLKKTKNYYKKEDGLIYVDFKNIVIKKIM